MRAASFGLLLLILHPVDARGRETALEAIGPRDTGRRSAAPTKTASSAETLSEEDLEVIRNLELLENLEQASELELLLELSEDE